jgi:hypothetical protein
MNAPKNAPLTPKGHGANLDRGWPNEGCSALQLAVFGEDGRQV